MEAVVIFRETILRFDAVYKPVVLDDVGIAFYLPCLFNQLFQAV